MRRVRLDHDMRARRVRRERLIAAVADGHPLAAKDPLQLGDDRNAARALARSLGNPSLSEAFVGLALAVRSVVLVRSVNPDAPVSHDSRMGMDRGLVGRLPFLAMGTGAPMLFIGGLAFQAGVEAAGTEWMTASLLEPFAKRRQVLFVNRRSGLPRGMSMADLAAEHADAIRSLEVGPVDVAGLSTAAASPSNWPPIIPTSSIASCSCALPAGSDRRGGPCSAEWQPAFAAAPAGRRSP